VDIAAVPLSKSAQRIRGERVVTEPKTPAAVRRVALPPDAVGALRPQAEAQLRRGHGGNLVSTA